MYLKFLMQQDILPNEHVNCLFPENVMERTTVRSGSHRLLDLLLWIDMYMYI